MYGTQSIDVRGDGKDSGFNGTCSWSAGRPARLDPSASLRTGSRGRPSLHCLVFLMLATFLQLSLERVLGAVAGLGEIAVGTVHHGVGVTVPELALHGVVAALGTFVRLLRTLPAVGIIEKMIAGAFRHGRPFEMHTSMITGLGYAESWQRAISCLFVCTCKSL